MFKDNSVLIKTNMEMANAIPDQLRKKILTEQFTENQFMDFISDPETDSDVQWYALKHYEALVKMIELREKFRKRRVIREQTQTFTLKDAIERERH